MSHSYYHGMLSSKKEEAKRVVRDFLFSPFATNTMENSPVQHRIYERKALGALLHVLGIWTGDLLVEEASARGLTTAQTAGLILGQVNELNQVEIRRMRVNVKIDACAKISDIGKLLIDEQIPVPAGVDFFEPAGVTPPADEPADEPPVEGDPS